MNSELAEFRRSLTKELAQEENRMLSLDQGNKPPPATLQRTTSPRASNNSTGPASSSMPVLSFLDGEVGTHSFRFTRPREVVSALGTQPKRLFVLAVDYGTATLALSFTIHNVDEVHLWASPRGVYSVDNWPDAGVLSVSKQCPTESWYSATPRKRESTENEPESEENLYDSEDEHTTGSFPFFVRNL